VSIDGTGKGATEPPAIQVAPYWRLLVVQWKGILSAIFRCPAVSDYVLPHIIALGTLIVGIWFNWDSITTWVGAFSGG
jgi:hypothetical protein